MSYYAAGEKTQIQWDFGWWWWWLKIGSLLCIIPWVYLLSCTVKISLFFQICVSFSGSSEMISLSIFHLPSRAYREIFRELPEPIFVSGTCSVTIQNIKWFTNYDFINLSQSFPTSLTLAWMGKIFFCSDSYIYFSLFVFFESIPWPRPRLSRCRWVNRPPPSPAHQFPPSPVWLALLRVVLWVSLCSPPLCPAERKNKVIIFIFYFFNVSMILMKDNTTGPN